MRNEEPRMLAALNGLIFGFIAGWIALEGEFDSVLCAFAALSALFLFSTWCAGRHELRPLIASWLATIGAFLWSIEAQGGSIQNWFDPVYLLVAAYLVIGLIVSVILYRENRDRKAQPMLERKARG